MTPDEQPSESQDEFDIKMYMEVMREDPPFTRYVSRGDTPDSVDIPGPHQEADRAIFRAVRFTMQDGTPRFQPVLGDAGMGKTHLYWVIKEQEHIFSKGKFLAVYVPSPPAPIRVPLHFHACIVDEFGDDLFEQAVDMLITKFGGLKGVTHETYDYTYALERLLVDYPGISADVVKALLRYRLDPPTSELARRWLLGDALDDEEIGRLGVRTVLEEDDVTLATLRLLAEGSEIPIVLFIDEMEGPYNTHGEEGERHFFEVLKRLYNECKNYVLIASSLAEIWERLYEIADAPMKSRMEHPAYLRHFTEEDVYSFVTESMSKYWETQNMNPPPNLLFPLAKSDVQEAFTTSKGVPREAIRYIISKVDSILFETPEEEVEEQLDYVIRLTPTVILGAISQALTLVGYDSGVAVSLHMASGGTQKQSAAILVVEKEGLEYWLGIDVPNVKDWNRSGGVSAYYSAKRLKDALESKEVIYSLVAVPEGTKGAKFESIRTEISKSLSVLMLSEETATALVEQTNSGQVDATFRSYFSDLIGRVLEKRGRKAKTQ
ncbi:MAG: hypothetical protein JSW61_14860 [Candidatus Thorarchaeota archaeon]|nr:MAG: hypothetical protein JSW61_14860 [Candidatus Thorarchaeota archaeon]